MKAIRWKEKKLEFLDVEQPIAGQNEAIVKVSMAGVCNTDLEITHSYGNFEGILGHEFVGRVVEDPGFGWVGKRVVADINFSCHKCDFCNAGHFHHCPSRTVMGILNRDGVFAEFVTIPIKNLIEIPHQLNDLKAVFAEPLAAAIQIQEQLKELPKRVCVLGDGKLGLLIAMYFESSGVSTTLVGRHPARKKKLGKTGLNYVAELPRERFPVVVEASGNPEGFKSAITLTEPMGTLVLKSTCTEGFEFNPSPIVVNEIRVLGSRCGPLDKALQILRSGKVDPEPLIDKVFNLDSGLDALYYAAEKGTLKVLLQM